MYNIETRYQTAFELYCAILTDVSIFFVHPIYISEGKLKHFSPQQIKSAPQTSSSEIVIKLI